MTDSKSSRPLGILLGILIAVMGILSGAFLVESVVARFAFQPTPSPVSVAPTYTSTVTYTPTNTPTSTCTPIPTPTNTPTSTSTPTPTPTGTLPPTETPTPKPDAVVNTDALNLRSGPGVVYDVLGVLKQGDPLKVTGRDLAGNWLKVVTPGGQGGWVAASLLEINLPLAGVDVAQVPPTPMHTSTPTVTPTPELLPAPILLEPENEASFIGPVLLKWQWDRPLAQDEHFSLRVRKEGETEPCHHGKVYGLEYFGDLTYCSAGKHYWSVALIRELCTDCPEEVRWETLSESSAERWIYYVPGEEPWEWPTPDSGGEGDNGDDGVGGKPPPP